MATIPVKKATVGKKSVSIKKDTTVPVAVKKNKSKVSRKKTSNILTPQSLHKNNKSVKVLISDNTRKQSKETVIKTSRKLEKAAETSITVPFTRSLSVLSPFRLPMPSEHFVSGFARAAGIFFAVTGALLSLVNLSTVNGFGTQTASVTTTAVESTIDATVASQGASIDATPDVRILIEGSTELMGIVPVAITVSGAREVKLYAESKTDAHVFLAGSAVRIDASNWRAYWNTEFLLNGEYRLFATVLNEYGSYNHHDSTSYLVSNTPATEVTGVKADISATQVTTTTGSETTGAGEAASTTEVHADGASTTTATEAVPELTVSLHLLDSNPQMSNAPLKIYAKNSTEVKIYARNTSTYVVYFAGYATLVSDTEWKFNWDTTKVPDGSYALSARAKFESRIVNSSYVQAKVFNNEEVRASNEIPQGEQVPISVASEPLDPEITFKLAEEGPVSNSVRIEIETSPVMFVEMYALSKSSLTPYFLGLATKISDQKWSFIWATDQTPNGEYFLYVRVKTNYGFTESEKQTVRVLNEVVSTFTTEQEKSFDSFRSVDDSLVKTTTTTDIPRDTFPLPETIYVEPIDVFVESISLEEIQKDEVTRLLTDFNADLSKKLEELGTAIRNDDTDAVTRLKGDIETLKTEALQNIPSSEGSVEIAKNVHAYITERSFELIELTTKNEKILKDRFGENIVQDSDTDGIFDYDEINLYRTNPFAADTDGDGYIDSIEVRLGYNPHDSNSEALVVYESPKETGIEREDILVIESISTLAYEDGEQESLKPLRAIISGKGLPNSFVTLYVYSTPIVVTVKTDNEGSWSYVFDKELEDGDHQIFAGITDNAGRIVAKSQSFSFVKTAEAFGGVKPTLQSSTVNQPSFIQEDSMLLVGSIAVSALGLVLILLGLHASRRKEELSALLST
ncbi:MAG: Ig-like domain-containing protein [Minisyncoccia bacterium]